ncbi:KN motif and ankyrin repeat domain-containing protein 1-like isoform X4 [Mya arenaria]|uniref:KN motif and ankyrin repeat domain-containing protein 1-like isoform X4 n=1 Tax=Mya arenaria TaxID=6604 RepID=UPI0022E1E8B5|nr:KN motif and ankyrin repeat domain-containing protein 1-like isoform X4 [Mya arenaria]
MAHLEKLFVPEGLPDNPYLSLDSRVTYKSEMATAEMKEVKTIKPLKKEFHPITTEIHVTELRPIKLDPMPKNGDASSSRGMKHQTWERRLQSESAVSQTQPQAYTQSEYNNQYSRRRGGHESRTETRRSHSASRHEYTDTLPETRSNMIRTVTSRTGSYSGSSPASSPSGTMSPRDSEFKRRDVSPSYKMPVEEHVSAVDGKCTCCPYGYHVDVDFMSYCDTLSNQSYLKQLKRLQREKRKLRKSMEVYVMDQERTEGQSTIVNPMENHPYYKETTTNRLLDEIDTSVDQTINSIDTMMRSSQESQQSMYTDSGTATMQREQKKFNTFPKKVGKQVAKDLQAYNETFTATFNTNDRVDSNGSLSSISTVASERVQPYMQGYTATETTTTRTSNMTSQQLAETIAIHLPKDDGAAEAQTSTTNISQQSLQAIRESMAVSLQRMKELEEQVKAIPVLQVRISVLKEEKRLLGLQMQAQKHVNTVSRGVSDDTIDPPTPLSPRSPPPTLPKPKVKMAAVGDHSVHEPYVVQPELESTHVYERETIIVDRAQRQQAVFNPEDSKPLTRTVGVGEGNVFDDSMHIHEKELRTVIIGQGERTGKRNVGIECRVATRDVGVSYNFDTSVEKPTTRSVGITTETTALVTNVSFRSEEFTSALRNALAKSVRSVGIQANNRLQTTNVGIQHSNSSWNIRSIGVGDCSIDVEVRTPVARRSVSVDAFPDRMNRSVNTDYGWRLDAFTNTVNERMETDGTQTEIARNNNAATMTDKEHSYHATCQTDVKVFTALDVFRSNGTNTEKVLTYNTGMNTVLKPQMERGVNTISARDTRSYGVNTHGPDIRSMGVGDGVIEDSEDEYRFEEEGIETKTTYYTTAQDREDTKTDKGYEIERKYAGGTQSSQSQLVRSDSESRSESELDSNEEVVEETVWRTSGDGQFTVTTVTTKKVYSGDDTKNPQVFIDTKTVTGGPEVLGTAAALIQKEVESGRTSSSYTITRDRSSVSDYETDSSANMKSSLKTTIKPGISTTTQSTLGSTALERVLGEDYAKRLQSENESNAGGITSTQEYSTSSRVGSSGLMASMASSAATGSSAAAMSLGAELEQLGGRDGLSSSTSSTTVTRHTKIIRDGDSPEGTVTVTEETTSSGDLLPDKELFDSGLMSSSGSSASGLTSSGSWFSESGSQGGGLKSIMKKSSSTDSNSQKRGITFAETVVGGETDSDGSENSSDEEEEEEDEVIEESLSRGTTSDSDSSYEEGCYDSREGRIIYKCKDDEAIANGIPGAKMFDQNIRETSSTRRFELDSEVKEACQVLATYLEDSTQVQTKQLNSSIEVIQKEWFKVSSSKLADAHQNEDYLSCFNEISKRLLEYIVNMQDSNGNTAIHYAVSNCNFDIVSLLLDTGECDLNKRNKAGYTALIMATLASVQTQRQDEVVQRLFSMGEVNTRASKDGQTALMFAVRQGRTEMVKMLLDTGADMNIQDDEGSTALMCAAEHGHTEIIKMLLNTPGCDATISDNDGSTALSIAMDAGHKDAGVLLYAHVNFGPGHTPAPTKHKVRKSSSSSENTGATPL